MTFDPAEFVGLGGTLVAAAGFHVEAKSRTSLGRAYYGLFLAVRASVRRMQGRPVDDAIDHGRLTNALFSTKQDDLIALGTALNSLYTARQKADYKLDPERSWQKKLADPSYADLRIKEAQAALAHLPMLDLSPILTKV